LEGPLETRHHQKPIRFEPTDRRIRVEFADTIDADSAKAMLMREPGRLPVNACRSTIPGVEPRFQGRDTCRVLAPSRARS
jgi:hypothetical protein